MENFTLELENSYFDSIKELKEGEIVKGKIISINSREVIVDVGYKSEGIIPRDEFDAGLIENGSEVDVLVENVEDEEGKITLSFKKAREAKGWFELINNYKEGEVIEGVVSRKVKGGYMVNVLGIEGFLPQSLSMFKNMEDSKVIGEKFLFQIIKLSKFKESLILSRRDALRIEKEKAKEKIWETIKKGMLVKGRVKSVTNFGAFIDLGGVDGLLHIGDMSWKKITHPSEIVAVGDEIEVLVIDFDRQKGKVSLGLKQTTPDPWQEIDKKYQVGSSLKGRITNIQSYGIFVELEKGIEGLVHISEISWTKKFINLTEMFAIGDIIEVKIIGIDSQQRKIALSIKQLEKDPWEEIENLISLNSEVKGKIINYGEDCAYVELSNNLEGVIYSEDISWTMRVNKVAEVLKKSQTYNFKVLGLDKSNRQVILGMKQLSPDPWPEIVEKFPIGKVLEVEVIKVTNFGVFVKIAPELEGLVFSQNIDPEVMQKLKPQDTLTVKIIKIDPSTAKIGLSAKID